MHPAGGQGRLGLGIGGLVGTSFLYRPAPPSAVLNTRKRIAFGGCNTTESDPRLPYCITIRNHACNDKWKQVPMARRCPLFWPSWSAPWRYNSARRDCWTRGLKWLKSLKWLDTWTTSYTQLVGTCTTGTTWINARERNPPTRGAR